MRKKQRQRYIIEKTKLNKLTLCRHSLKQVTGTELLRLATCPILGTGRSEVKGTVPTATKNLGESKEPRQHLLPQLPASSSLTVMETHLGGPGLLADLICPPQEKIKKDPLAPMPAAQLRLCARNTSAECPGGFREHEPVCPHRHTPMQLPGTCPGYMESRSSLGRG